MKAVGVRELKNRLSEYLRLVRNGEEIVVTDRGDQRRGRGAGSPTIPREPILTRSPLVTGHAYGLRDGAHFSSGRRRGELDTPF